MSNPVSALNGVSFNGAVTVHEQGLSGMITLRGDFADKAFVAAVKGVLGATVPAQRQVSTGEHARVLWMSPDEALCLVDHEKAEELTAKLADALKGTHALAVNVSDARAHFSVQGNDTRDALAKVMPVDFAQDVFGPGQVRRSRLAQVAAAVWFEDTDTAEIICFRSVSTYVFDVLCQCAQPNAAVGFHNQTVG